MRPVSALSSRSDMRIRLRSGHVKIEQQPEWADWPWYRASYAEPPVRTARNTGYRTARIAEPLTAPCEN